LAQDAAAGKGDVPESWIPPAEIQELRDPMSSVAVPTLPMPPPS
jgi:hypothetical protein